MNDVSPDQHDDFRASQVLKESSGLREVRLWVPNTRTTTFRAEARRQSALLDHSDDEREATAMMERLTAEAWQDWQ